MTHLVGTIFFLYPSIDSHSVIDSHTSYLYGMMVNGGCISTYDYHHSHASMTVLALDNHENTCDLNTFLEATIPTFGLKVSLVSKVFLVSKYPSFQSISRFKVSLVSKYSCFEVFLALRWFQIFVTERERERD